MTAKEKAKELVDKYCNLQEKIEWGNVELRQNAGLIYEENNVEYDKYYYELAKQSALTAVEEILEFEKRIVKQIESHIELFKEMEFKTESYYWEEVKQEIKKL